MLEKSPRGIKISREQERRVAQKMGGKVQRGSGRGGNPVGTPLMRLRVGNRGDVYTDVTLVECKTTDKQSISLHQGYLIKITREAGLSMKSPAVVISFPTMPDGVENDWILLPLAVWKKLSDLTKKANVV
jgi:hypothetical protein